MAKNAEDIISLHIEIRSEMADSKFRLVHIASQRVRELSGGEQPLVTSRSIKDTTVALEESLLGAYKIIVGEDAKVAKEELRKRKEQEKLEEQLSAKEEEITAGIEMMGKYLQFLKEAIPPVCRVAVLMTTRPTPADPGGFMRELEAAAPALKVTLELHRAVDPAEFEGVFSAMTRGQAEALLVVPHPFATIHAQRIVELATQRRLPVVSDRPFISAGGLLSYDVNQPELWRRIGLYVDKIFKGANPGDLPVEQPTKFELLINLKTAKALGVTIPQSLLNRADEVIE